MFNIHLRIQFNVATFKAINFVNGQRRSQHHFPIFHKWIVLIIDVPLKFVILLNDGNQISPYN